MMEFDPAALQRLDDRQLSELVKQISAAAGADQRKTAALLGNLDLLRNSLGQLTPEQAKQFLDRAGEDKSREIYDLIRKNGG